MKLEDKIKELLRISDNHDFAIIINSKYFCVGGKMVYASLNRNLKNDRLLLEFHTTSARGEIEKHTPVSNAIPKIESLLLQDHLFGVFAGGEKSLENCKISFCSKMHVLIFESHLYNLVQRWIKLRNPSALLRIGTETLDSNKIEELANAFKEESLLLYRDLIFSTKSNRFIGKLGKYKKFYSIQKVFVPVFVNYLPIYNPLQDPDLHVEEFALYKKAQEKNRKVEIDDVLSCYLLTQKEICESLKMSHFMRFTPLFLYNLYVGLLLPSNVYFPNQHSKLLMRPRGMQQEENQPLTYSITDYEQLLRKADAELSAAKDSDRVHYWIEKRNSLAQYQLVTSLFFACSEAHDSLTKFGPTSLDNKRTSSVEAIYDYVCEAVLVT